MRTAAWISLFVCVGCNSAGSTPSHNELPGTTTSEPPAASGGGREPAGDPQPRLPLGRVVLQAPPRAPVELRVEVADTDEARRRGLMFRKALDEDEGMFFVFPAERQHSFWMRNTLIPLDMFFIGADFEVIGVVENATPSTDTPRSVDGRSQYVLEVNAGFASEHGFGAGTQVRYTPPEQLEREN